MGSDTVVLTWEERMRQAEEPTEEVWDHWTKVDVDGQAEPKLAAFLRTTPSLQHWQAALVRYQKELDCELTGYKANPEQSDKQRQLAIAILRTVRKRQAERKKLQKEANLLAQKQDRQAAKERRRERNTIQGRRALTDKLLRASPDGQRLHIAIHKLSLRLNRWADRLVEEMGLDEEDEVWSRWKDEVENLNRMVTKYEDLVTKVVDQT